MSGLMDLLRPRSPKEAAVALLSPERPAIRSEPISIVEDKPFALDWHEQKTGHIYRHWICNLPGCSPIRSRRPE